LTNVSGTLQAHVDVTGPADDPRPAGIISIDNAKFLVPFTGVAYTGLAGKIALQPDRVHIDEIRVLDNRRQPLSISGDLALHERTVGGVSIAIKSDDFKVIDNKMGSLRIKTNLQISGELTAPRVDGELGVATGQLDLDQILAKATSSPYATAPTENPSRSQEGESSSSAFDALQMGVRLTVPDDLVIKASDLQAPGSPIGLGALNLTLGGDIWVSKAPLDPPRLTGNINTIRGTYVFQNRRFEILRDGKVRFEGDTISELDPALDIRTERSIQAVLARVNVRGTLTQPEIVLESTPPLEQADILALIIFNQPVNQLGMGQQASLASTAQQMATGAVAGQLAQSVAGALNLDTFEINTAPDNGGPASVTVGQQLGQNLYVKVQQGIGDLSQTNFLIEYELTKWLRLRTNMLQGSSTQQQLFQRMQGSGVDLLFFFSY
jgi:translocation and assembly module TamB